MDIPPAQPPTPDDPGSPENAPHAPKPQDGPPPYPNPPSPYAAQPPLPDPPYAPTAYGPNPYDAKGGPYDGNPYGTGPYGPHGPNPYDPNPYGYPPGGPGPQGYWNPGWYAPPRSTNGLAIAALVVSIVVWFIPLLALIFGIVALRQIRRTGQSGRGMAIAGIVINSLGTAVIALLITLAAIGALDDGNTDVQDLKPGQCFNTVGSSLSDYSGEGHRSTRAEVVPCRDEHDAEAYAVFTPDSGDYPGVDRLSEMADARCLHLAEGYLGDSSLPDGMNIYYYLPPHDGWDRGDRSVTCFFGSRGGRVTGSVASTGHDSGVGV